MNPTRFDRHRTCIYFLFLDMTLLLIAGCTQTPAIENIPPEVESKSDAPTPTIEDIAAPSSDEGNDNADSGYTHSECADEAITVKVVYDHDWVWSPDGTDATGALKGEAEGGCTFSLWANTDGSYETDTCMVFYSQSGTIQSDPGSCRVTGNGKRCLKSARLVKTVTSCWN